ncbi:hypothetical protein HanIR_Chr17g0900411 [Helianthus annuus]|nr:hypothetical protein HanIR_Chr17g0900411 [Helianthus annuus]
MKSFACAFHSTICHIFFRRYNTGPRFIYFFIYIFFQLYVLLQTFVENMK